jgi:hypothetical protein
MYLGELQAFAAYANHGARSDEYVERLRAQLTEASSAGWVGAMSVAASNLAETLCFRGDFAEAASLAGDAVRLFRTQERPVDLGLALSCRAGALAELGRTEEAVGAASESALIALSLRLPGNIGDALRASVLVALLTGQPYLAARLWGSVRRLNEGGGYDLPPDYRRIGERHLARASPAAPSVAIELAIREGEAEDPVELLRNLPKSLRTAGTAPTLTSEPSPR